MKRLYFVRHGKTEMNAQNRWSGDADIPLAAAGHEQARQTGKKLKAEALQFDLIVSSPLERALDTAKHIAKELGYPENKIIVSKLLKERHFGRLEGTPYHWYVTVPYMLSENYVDKYGSEPFSEVKKRASDAAAYLHSLEAETVLVVSHAAFGRALYSAFHPLRQRKLRYKNAKVMRFI